MASVDLLTGLEVCDALGVSFRQLQRWRKEHGFPGPVDEDGQPYQAVPGKATRLYWSWAAVEAWLDVQKALALEQAITRAIERAKIQFERRRNSFAFRRKRSM